MSSDSEVDEFYDAEDVTPANRTISSPSSTLHALEKEEKLLLQLKKASEERRSREEQELKQRLQELQEKKLYHEKEQEYDRKSEASSSRRKKLEEMRQSVLDDKSPRHVPRPCDNNDAAQANDNSNCDSNESEIRLSPDLSIIGDSHSPDEVTEATASPNVDTVQQETSSVDTTVPEVAKDVMESRKASLREGLQLPLLVSEGSHVCPDHSEHASCDSEAQQIVDLPSDNKMDENKYNQLSENLNEIQPEKEKISKSIEELFLNEYNRDSVSDEDVTIRHVIEQEPDLIQSVKGRNITLPDPSAPPVAPPRKRKKAKSDSSKASMLPGLPSERLTPTSTIDILTKDLEYSLDLRSAISGGRLVRVQDIESTSPVNDPKSDESVSVDDPLKTSEQQKPTSKEEMQDLRPRSNSGRLLTDDEILQSVTIVNLDTGERIPLSAAADKLPRCLNPLSLHIMRRTKEFSGKSHCSDDEDGKADDDAKNAGSFENVAKKKATKLKKFLGKTMNKTVSKMKTVADQGKKALQGDETSMEEEISFDGKKFKIKASRDNKGPYDFSQLRLLQDLSGEHTGAVWTMKFSPCGRLLATGGQDSVLRIWVLRCANSYFEDMRQKCSEIKVSPAPSQESLNSISSETASLDTGAFSGTEADDATSPFMKRPFCAYRGHSAHLLDVCWSKNYFILSSSMDKTVRLWHISRRECLCVFQHIDFVTAIVFHPRDDRYFLSGSLDGQLRLWNIPDKKVALWNEVAGPCKLITAANFCHNGKYAVVGTYDGKCIFYSTEQLKYYTQIHVRSTRGKNAKGCKITGIEPLPGEDKMLVTSNDSRMRLYDLRDLTLTCKYKGGTNNNSQIKASFSSKAKYIICGSEDHFLYVWKTQHDNHKMSSARRDRNDYWEAIKVHNAVVTSAIFAPNPALFSKKPLDDDDNEKKENPVSERGEIIISGDFLGTIKVIENKQRVGS